MIIMGLGSGFGVWEDWHSVVGSEFPNCLSRVLSIKAEILIVAERHYQHVERHMSSD